MHRSRIFGLNNIKLYAKNEQINLYFHWMVRYAKNCELMREANENDGLVLFYSQSIVIRKLLYNL